MAANLAALNGFACYAVVIKRCVIDSLTACYGAFDLAVFG